MENYEQSNAVRQAEAQACEPAGLQQHLPSDFVARMRMQLGDEAEAFLECYRAAGYSGLRANTGKIRPRELAGRLPFALRSVPWAENGFYTEKDAPVSKHPYYYAGLYYIQEPSAMLPASRLPVEPGDMVLDLCAAPGGKATELASRLKGQGLLVANDVSAGRAKALLKNLSLWGAPNVCITAETPQRLLEAFGCCFDKILVDAPCSGEGMFRRNSSLIGAWQEKGPAAYAKLQREILACAVQMLKPGGMLLYSTCTFSPEEDEDVISDMLERFPELSLVPMESEAGFTRGKPPCENCLRIYPHRVEGEGHFLALLQKSGGCLSERMVPCTRQEVAASRSRMPDAVRHFLTLLPEHFLEAFCYGQIGEQCLLVPPWHLPRLRYLRTGLLLGTWKRGRFEPSQSLAMLLDGTSFGAVLDLRNSDGRVLRYLRGETLELTEEESLALQTAGLVLVCVDGYALGWGKYAGGSVKNKYYPGWRLQ